MTLCAVIRRCCLSKEKKKKEEKVIRIISRSLCVRVNMPFTKFTRNFREIQFGNGAWCFCVKICWFKNWNYIPWWLECWAWSTPFTHTHLHISHFEICMSFINHLLLFDRLMVWCNGFIRINGTAEPSSGPLWNINWLNSSGYRWGGPSGMHITEMNRLRWNAKANYKANRIQCK